MIQALRSRKRVRASSLKLRKRGRKEGWREEREETEVAKKRRSSRGRRSARSQLVEGRERAKRGRGN